MSITEGKIEKARYAEAIIQFLRLREFEEGPTSVYYKVISNKAMIMVGLTHEDVAQLTPKNEYPAEEHKVNLAYQVLKHMGLLRNTCRGFWGLTKKGRKSKATHRDYIRAIDEINEENAAKRKQRKLAAK